MIDQGCVSGFVGIVNSSMVDVFIGVMSSGMRFGMLGSSCIVMLIVVMLMSVLVYECRCLCQLSVIGWGMKLCSYCCNVWCDGEEFDDMDGKW